MSESSSKEALSKSWTYLSRTSALTIITFLYAGIYLAAWTVTAVSVYRPITGGTYYYDKNSTVSYEGDQNYPKSQRLLRWARVLQSIASVLTVPLILGVCSQTAVVILQGRWGRGITLRQTMALADKGWADIGLLSRMIFRRRWRQHASPFFYVALILTGLGALISPLQQVFVSYTTIKVPGGYYDVATFVSTASETGAWIPKNTTQEFHLALVTRDHLMSADPDDPQFRLWSNNVSFNSVGAGGNYYWAEFPSTFHTGVVTQFAPRINHTARFEDIDIDLWPDECKNQANQTLFAEYNEITEMRALNTTVCFPRALQSTTLRNTDERQDFTEEMYLRIAFGNRTEESYREFGAAPFDLTPGQYAVRIQLNTTVGYFEVPNYMNNMTAGPLIDGDPNNLCSPNPTCQHQGLYSDPSDASELSPLLIIAVALFGNSSFVAQPLTQSTDFHGCPMPLPLLQFLVDGYVDDERFCPPYAKENYLWLFLDRERGGPKMQRAFEAAAFITTDVMVTAESNDRSLGVGNVPGVDFLVPQTSLTGVVVISTLLGIFLLFLLFLTIVNARTMRWTSRLDSFALMRIGTVVHEDLSLDVASNVDGVTILDQTPGWIGDSVGATKDRTQIHSVALGAEHPLDGKYRYQSHQGSAYVPPRQSFWNRNLPQRPDPTRKFLLVAD